MSVDTDSHKQTAKGIDIAKTRGDVAVTVNNTFNFVIPENSEISEDKKLELQKMILESFQKGELQAVYAPSAKMLNEYKQSGCEFDEEVNLELLKGKISDSDLMVIRTGLYLRYLDQRGDYEKLKRIRNGAIRDDLRTRNILNLVTAGYFKEYIMPVFEKENADKALEYYEEVVMYLPEIIFVYNDMSVDELIDKVDMKIRQRERYHVVKVKRIIVNGIGKHCIQIMAKAQMKLSEKYQYPEYDVSFNTSSGALPRAQLQIRF